MKTLLVPAKFSRIILISTETKIIISCWNFNDEIYYKSLVDIFKYLILKSKISIKMGIGDWGNHLNN